MSKTYFSVQLFAQEKAETSKSFYTDGLSIVQTNLSLSGTDPACNRTHKDSILIQDFCIASRKKKKELKMNR